jgi:hypothetical protein
LIEAGRFDLVGRYRVRIRKHLSYANVTATLALVLSLAGGAYAITRVGSHDIVNNSIKSIDLKNGKAVKGADVRRNALTGRQIDERQLDPRSFASVAGNQAGDCDPASSTTFINCATATVRLERSEHVLVIATGNQESVGAHAGASCRMSLDGVREGLAVLPGEETIDNTSSTGTNGFARTLVTRHPLPKGSHKVALACKEFSGDVRIDAPTIAAIAIGSR